MLPSYSSRSPVSGLPRLEADSFPNLDSAFESKLRQSVQDAVRASLGDSTFALISERGVLERSSNAIEFHKDLERLLGNGASMIEKIIVRELFRKLGLTSPLQSPFDYEESLVAVRMVYFVEAGLKRERR